MIKTTFHTLDYKGLYELKLDYDTKQHSLTVSVSDRSNPWSRLVNAIQKQLRVEQLGDSQGDVSSLSVKTRHGEGNSVIIDDVPAQFALKLNQETIGTYTLDAQTGRVQQKWHRPATAFEVRRLGTFHNASLYPQQRTDLSTEDNKQLLDYAKKSVFTDFHSHSSGQISPEALMKVALEHDMYYPLKQLEEVSIDTSYQRFPKNIRKPIDRVEFPPRDTPNMPKQVNAVPLRALTEEERRQLMMGMAMPGDKQDIFSNMENDAYRLRYPLTKKDEIMHDTVLEMIRENTRNGVKHCDVSMVGLEKPHQLKAVHAAIYTAEHDDELKDTSTHYFLGIPRKFTLEKIEHMLMQAKILSASPYITGIDLIGHETNKTQAFADTFDEFCAWANEHRPGFTVRVHAGENDKNLSNVKEVLLLADKYPNLHFRVGHGIHGLDAETIALLKKLNADPHSPRVIIEFNPDSVLALNNIDTISEIPFDTLIKNQQPFIVSSDSAGTYGTTPEQLGINSFYAGIDHEGFSWLRGCQTLLMEQQRHYAQGMAANIPGWDTAKGREHFLDGLLSELKQLPPAPAALPPAVPNDQIVAKLEQDEVKLVKELPPELKKLTPIIVVGANGDRWQNMIDPVARREIAIACDMLTHALDSEKAYFTEGRAKETGLSYVMHQAITSGNEHLQRSHKHPFYNLGIILGPRFPIDESFTHLTHLQHIEAEHLDIAHAMTSHARDNNGMIIAAGGAIYTRDIITKADQQRDLPPTEGKDADSMRIPLFLFSNARGGSQQKSEVLDHQYAVEDGILLLQKIYAERPQLFRPGIHMDSKSLKQLYAESSARVDERGYDAPPNPAGHMVETMHTIDLTKEKGK